MIGGAAAVSRNECGRIGMMVRTARELYIYWDADRAVTLRVTDLSGRTPWWRELPTPRPGGAYVRDLLPGHLYAAELLDEDGRPIIGAGPVQTPWLPGATPSPFPKPYHRS